MKNVLDSWNRVWNYQSKDEENHYMQHYNDDNIKNTHELKEHIYRDLRVLNDFFNKKQGGIK